MVHISHFLLTVWIDQAVEPVVAIVVPGNVYLTYGILILTSSMHVAFFPLNLRSEPQGTPERQSTPSLKTGRLRELAGRSTAFLATERAVLATCCALPAVGPAIQSTSRCTGVTRCHTRIHFDTRYPSFSRQDR
jgi:hypothetical protein